MIIRIFFFTILSVIANSAIADKISLPKETNLTKEEAVKIYNEAENWIDDIPDGLQDRMADAVYHAKRGVTSELQYFRNYNIPISEDVKDISVIDTIAGPDSGIKIRIYSQSYQSTQSPKQLLIYFHGGGWSLGSLNTSDNFCRNLVVRGGIVVVSVDYPLSPENPHPIAVKSALKAFDYIYKNAESFGTRNNLISLGGDGAGGSLALELFESLEENDRSGEVESIILYYPLFKFSNKSESNSMKTYGRGYGFDTRLWEAFLESYGIMGMSEKMNSLPPVLLITAGRDIMIDDQKYFTLNNPTVNLIEFKDALHGFITDQHQNTAFEKAVDITNIFLKSIH